MSTLNEILTVGLVLVLLFGSICLYLYTRIQQNEQKLNLVENILLDLKIANEIKGYPDLPAPVGGGSAVSSPASASYKPMDIPDVEMATGIEETANDSSADGSGSSSANLEALEEETLPFEATTEDAANGSAANGSSATSPEVINVPTTKVSANYTAMTFSELKALAKQRGVAGTNGMRRQQLIEALNTSDRVSAVNSAANGAANATQQSFLEISA
jgi:hypothetical protein